MRMLRLSLVAATLLAGQWSAPAQTTHYPQRPVTVIVPFPAGSATDVAARMVSEGLHKRLGQTFIVENKPGADGSIAARFVARAPADGYTLLVTTSTTHSANPSIYEQLPYDPDKDFAAIGGIIRIPFMLGIRPDLEVNDFPAFLTAARAAKPSFSYGSANAGSRIAAELLRHRYAFDLVHVPYRGSPQVLTDLIGGRIDIFFADPAAGLALFQDKQFKVLAVTGPKRVPAFAQIPTLAELGAGDFNVVSWVAAFAPAGTPEPIIRRLNAALNEVLAAPEAIAFANHGGSEIMATTPEELAAFVKVDAERWRELVGLAKIEKK